MGERVAAVVDQLRARLAAAQRAETLGVVQAAREAAEAHGKSLGTWWAKTAPAMFAELRRGAELLDLAETASGE
jgi:hypothetical protein